VIPSTCGGLMRNRKQAGHDAKTSMIIWGEEQPEPAMLTSTRTEYWPGRDTGNSTVVGSPGGDVPSSVLLSGYEKIVQSQRGTAVAAVDSVARIRTLAPGAASGTGSLESATVHVGWLAPPAPPLPG